MNFIKRVIRKILKSINKITKRLFSRGNRKARYFKILFKTSKFRKNTLSVNYFLRQVHAENEIDSNR